MAGGDEEGGGGINDGGRGGGRDDQRYGGGRDGSIKVDGDQDGANRSREGYGGDGYNKDRNNRTD